MTFPKDTFDTYKNPILGSGGVLKGLKELMGNEEKYVSKLKEIESIVLHFFSQFGVNDIQDPKLKNEAFILQILSKREIVSDLRSVLHDITFVGISEFTQNTKDKSSFIFLLLKPIGMVVNLENLVQELYDEVDLAIETKRSSKKGTFPIKSFFNRLQNIKNSPFFGYIQDSFKDQTIQIHTRLQSFDKKPKK